MVFIRTADIQEGQHSAVKFLMEEGVKVNLMANGYRNRFNDACLLKHAFHQWVRCLKKGEIA